MSRRDPLSRRQALASLAGLLGSSLLVSSLPGS
jgi:hypothetical protein